MRGAFGLACADGYTRMRTDHLNALLQPCPLRAQVLLSRATLGAIRGEKWAQCGRNRYMRNDLEWHAATRERAVLHLWRVTGSKYLHGQIRNLLNKHGAACAQVFRTRTSTAVHPTERAV